ncbi:MAG: hypothetical protein O6927_00735 [Gammaproteobacteria bacterium]|nr:hypothetical protein [Gammaproteobacteria bacterium]
MRQWFESAVRQLSDVEYSTLLVFMAALCASLLYCAYAAYWRYRFISGTATSRIRSAAQGYVELKGRGEFMPGDELLSPFSGSRCLWYQCTVDSKQKQGQRTTWTNISDEISDNLFHLVDNTGVCVIDPENAHVIAELNRTWYGSSTEDRSRPPETRSMMVRLGIGSYRFNEKLIRPASAIYALGMFRTLQHTASTGFIDNEVKELLRQWKLHPQKYLSQFDRDGNGKINKQEWKAIHHQARQAVIRTIEANQSQNLLTNPDQSGRPFILSAVGEKSLVLQKKILAVSAGSIAFLLFVIIINIIRVRP